MYLTFILVKRESEDVSTNERELDLTKKNSRSESNLSEAEEQKGANDGVR